MAGLFDGLFDFTDIEKKTSELLADKYGKARANVEGQFGGMGREAQANLDIQNQRQGIIGSPLASTLSARLSADIGRKKAQTLAGVDAQEASDTATMGIQNAQMQNQAKSQLFNSIFQGLGSIGGMLVGGPLGAAAGSALTGLFAQKPTAELDIPTNSKKYNSNGVESYIY